MCEVCESRERAEAHFNDPNRVKTGREVAYEAHIEPLITQLQAVCKAHDVPLLLSVNLVTQPMTLNVVCRSVSDEEPREFEMACELLHLGAENAARKRIGDLFQKVKLSIAADELAASTPGGGH